MDGPFVLLADHVQVALEDGRDRPLAPGPSGLADDDIAHAVLGRFQSQSGGQRQHVVARRSLLFRGPWDGRQGREVPPQRRRFQVDQSGIHNSSVSCTTHYRTAAGAGRPRNRPLRRQQPVARRHQRIQRISRHAPKPDRSQLLAKFTCLLQDDYPCVRSIPE